jgi:hypothetical protein
VEQQAVALAATATMGRLQILLLAVQGRTLGQGLDRVAQQKAQQTVTGTAARTAGRAAASLGARSPSVLRVVAGVSGRSGSGSQHAWRQQQPPLLLRLRLMLELAVHVWHSYLCKRLAH